MEKTKLNEHEQQKKDSYIKQLVANARAVISFQVGMPFGCLRASKILYWLRPLNGPSYQIFEEYMEATRDLPIGDERLQWDTKKLKKYDKKLEKVNAKFREKIMEACQDIVRKYGDANE